MTQVAHNFKEKLRTGDVIISENVDFSGLLLSEPVLQGLKKAGFAVPSPIQLKAIPLGRCGLDMIVQAKSGTGKTCVFSVVALESIHTDTSSTQVLVLAPTREIAVQIQEVITSIGSAIAGLQCHTFIGGLPIHEDRQKLKRCHIAVGSPGRVKQLIECGILKTDSIRLFVLDEADKLLEESFQEQINWIYSTLPENKQMLALSATYPEYLADHLTAYMRNPTFIRLNVSDPALLGIRQYYAQVPHHPVPHMVFETKSTIVINILSSINFQQCLIFSNLRTRAQNLADKLTNAGWPTACIAGCLDQKDRNHAMAKLKSYQCRVLISTDLTSRGIDADKVNLVINLDVPGDHETYLHRIGRAGRFGAFGISIALVSEGTEERNLNLIRKRCNTTIVPLPEPLPSDLASLQSTPVFLDSMVTTEVINTEGTHAPRKDYSPETSDIISNGEYEGDMVQMIPDEVSVKYEKKTNVKTANEVVPETVATTNSITNNDTEQHSDDKTKVPSSMELLKVIDHSISADEKRVYNKVGILQEEQNGKIPDYTSQNCMLSGSNHLSKYLTGPDYTGKSGKNLTKECNGTDTSNPLLIRTGEHRDEMLTVTEVENDNPGMHHSSIGQHIKSETLREKISDTGVDCRKETNMNKTKAVTEDMKTVPYSGGISNSGDSEAIDASSLSHMRQSASLQNEDTEQDINNSSLKRQGTAELSVSSIGVKDLVEETILKSDLHKSQSMRTVPEPEQDLHEEAEMVNLSELFKKTIGFTPLKHHHSYESAKESLDAFRQSGNGTEIGFKVCVPALKLDNDDKDLRNLEKTFLRLQERSMKQNAVDRPATFEEIGTQTVGKNREDDIPSQNASHTNVLTNSFNKEGLADDKNETNPKDDSGKDIINATIDKTSLHMHNEVCVTSNLEKEALKSHNKTSQKARKCRRGYGGHFAIAHMLQQIPREVHEGDNENRAEQIHGDPKTVSEFGESMVGHGAVSSVEKTGERNLSSLCSSLNEETGTRTNTELIADSVPIVESSEPTQTFKNNSERAVDPSYGDSLNENGPTSSETKRVEEDIDSSTGNLSDSSSVEGSESLDSVSITESSNEYSETDDEEPDGNSVTDSSNNQWHSKQPYAHQPNNPWQQPQIWQMPWQAQQYVWQQNMLAWQQWQAACQAQHYAWQQNPLAWQQSKSPWQQNYEQSVSNGHSNLYTAPGNVHQEKGPHEVSGWESGANRMKLRYYSQNQYIQAMCSKRKKKNTRRKKNN